MGCEQDLAFVVLRNGSRVDLKDGQAATDTSCQSSRVKLGGFTSALAARTDLSALMRMRARFLLAVNYSLLHDTDRDISCFFRGAEFQVCRLPAWNA